MESLFLRHPRHPDCLPVIYGHIHNSQPRHTTLHFAQCGGPAPCVFPTNAAPETRRAEKMRTTASIAARCADSLSCRTAYVTAVHRRVH